jgi:hypothetical protein
MLIVFIIERNEKIKDYIRIWTRNLFEIINI